VWQDERWILVEGTSQDDLYSFFVVDQKGNSQKFTGEVDDTEKKRFSVKINVKSLEDSALPMVGGETLVVFTSEHSTEIVYEDFIDIEEVSNKSLNIMCSEDFSVTVKSTEGGLDITTNHDRMEDIIIGDLETGYTVTVTTNSYSTKTHVVP
jgi:hypothetical protein